MNRFKFIGNTLISILIPILFVIIWFKSSYSPIKDFFLINYPTIVNGEILKIEKKNGEYETNNKVVYYDYYIYEYKFKTKENKVIRSYGKVYGKIPKQLSNNDFFDTKKVEVEYLNSDPEISRIKGMEDNIISNIDWFKKKVLLGLLLTIFVIYISSKIFEGGKDKYLTLKKNTKKYNDYY